MRAEKTSSMSLEVLRHQPSPVAAVLHTQVPTPVHRSCLKSLPSSHSGGFCGSCCLLCLHPFYSSPLTHCPLLILGHAE